MTVELVEEDEEEEEEEEEVEDKEKEEDEDTLRVLVDDRVDWFVFWRFFEGSAMLRNSGRCDRSNQSKLLCKGAGTFSLP